MMQRPISRRKFLGGSVLACGAVLGYGAGIEPNRTAVTRTVLKAAGAANDRVVRMVQLSDLHLRKIGFHEERIAAVVNELRPDLIIASGDVSSYENGADLFERFLALVDGAIPVYGVLGNWDYWSQIDISRLADIYRRHGGRLLVNESVRLQYHGTDLLLTGLDDLLAGRPDMIRALTGATPADNHLVIAHCPGTRERMNRHLKRVEGFAPRFMLAGHTHGGQVSFFGWAPYLPPGSGRYRYGWYDTTMPAMFVSRGIGMSQLPIRFMEPPEVVFHEWHLV
jgi:predicted MPP superfamily phosphohydrolase